MSEQKQIEQLKEANETWRKRWASERYEVEQLKAQVNCLREAALQAISYMTGGEAKANLRDAYDATPEQCLAEVKAKAIEDALLYTEAIGSNGHDYDYDGAELQKYADKLREQSK